MYFKKILPLIFKKTIIDLLNSMLSKAALKTEWWVKYDYLIGNVNIASQHWTTGFT